MEQQAIENLDRLTNEDASEPAIPQVADLHLIDAEADEIKGGAICHGTTVLAWARVDGVSPLANHNETVAEDATHELVGDDLQLTEAQASDVKAAGWGSSSYQYAFEGTSATRPAAGETQIRS
jgi:hypothetical protein